MSFYLTLPSDASTGTFPDSKPSSYKVRLPRQVFLLEQDWEVALVTISFPDSQTYIPSETLGKFPFILRANKETFYVRASDLENATVPVKDGLSFVKKMIQKVHSDFYRNLSLYKTGKNWVGPDNHIGIPMFKWIDGACHKDLYINNSEINNFAIANSEDIHLKLAIALGLVKKNT